MKIRTRAGLGGLAFAVAASIINVSGAAPAAAQTDDDGLRVVADTVYRVFPDDGQVEVEVAFAVTNQVPNRQQGFQIIQTFFESIFDVIPDVAVDLKAVRDNGDNLAITPSVLSAEDAALFEESPFTVWDIDLGPNLFFQQTRRFTVSYRLPDGEARTDDAWARVNPAFASFPVGASGDPGLASVRVEYPPGYVVEWFGSDMERSNPFGATVLTADAIPDPQTFFAVMFGSSEIGLSSRPVEVEGIEGELIISSWPGDVEWDAFIERGLVEGIPLLVDEIGVEWPVEGELEVIETVAPALAGYAGWFYEPSGSDGTDAAIDVGEELLFDLLGHEIAHAWFNDDFTRMRWLNEGLAEYFGIRLATELEVDDLNEFDSVTPRSDGAVDLIEWSAPAFNLEEEEEATEEFGYSASYQLISELADEIGPERLEATLVALFAQQNPYRPALTDPGQKRVDWRDLLDGFEIVGGSEMAEDLFVTWVLGDDEEEELEGRSDAQAAVAGLADVDPGWATPDVLPQLLADWDFSDAQDLVAEMTAILDDAQALLDDAAARGLELPPEPQQAYESVETMSAGFDDSRAAVALQRTALDRVLGAYDRSDEPTAFFENIGLYGTDIEAVVMDAHAAFEAGDYDAAEALADDVDRLLDDAESLGQQRLLKLVGAVVGFLLLVLLLVLMIRRRRRGGMGGSGEEPEPEPEAPDNDNDNDNDNDDDGDDDDGAESGTGLFESFGERERGNGS